MAAFDTFRKLQEVRFDFARLNRLTITACGTAHISRLRGNENAAAAEIAAQAMT